MTKKEDLTHIPSFERGSRARAKGRAPDVLDAAHLGAGGNHEVKRSVIASPCTNLAISVIVRRRCNRSGMRLLLCLAREGEIAEA